MIAGVSASHPNASGSGRQWRVRQRLVELRGVTYRLRLVRFRHAWLASVDTVEGPTLGYDSRPTSQSPPPWSPSAEGSPTRCPWPVESNDGSLRSLTSELGSRGSEETLVVALIVLCGFRRHRECRSQRQRTNGRQGRPEEVTGKLASRPRVVIVNDAPAVLALYRDMLAELNYEPVVMATEAIETAKIRAAEPDAVVLDLTVGLQAEYGVEMAKELRADTRYAAIPIVVATANADALDGARAVLEEIGVPILLKPFTVEELDASLAADRERP